MESKPLWAWRGITGNLSRGLHALHIHCINIYLGKLPTRRTSEWHSQKRYWVPSICLRRLLLIFSKPFVLETNASKLGIWSCAITKQQTNHQYNPVAHASWSLTVPECNIIQPHRSFWHWSGWLQGSFRNTYSGSHSLSEPTIIHSPTSWLHLIWMLPDIVG